MIVMSMDTRNLIEETQPGYPLLPGNNDGRWQQMLVQARSRNASPLCSLPRLKMNYPLTTVYEGDLVSVVGEVRYGVWVAVKVDYLTGWINTLHLDLVPHEAETAHFNDFTHPQAGHEDQTMQAAQSVNDDFMHKMRKMGVTPDEPEETVTLSKKDLNRIVGYLKGIARTLRNARD